MQSFLEAVADLTNPRDIDQLDGRLASIIFHFVEASTVSVWRGAARDKNVILTKQLTRRLADMSVERERPDIQACPTTVQSSHPSDSPGGEHRHLFPVMDKDESGLTLEILRASPLVANENESVLILLHIYRNLVDHIESSKHDTLTGLLNRRTFDMSFEKAGAPETKSGREIVFDRRDVSKNGTSSHLAVIDIDHFKRVNDRFGHLYGDEVLVLLARLMKSCFRDTDRLFRFGGEEFVVILRGATLDQAKIALERFRTTIERFAFPQVGMVTVSIGFAAIQADDNGSNAFGRADEALYVAKRSGRNKVCSHETLTATGILTYDRVHERNVEMFG